MSIYRPLQSYLESRPEPSVTLGYDEIERILGRRLPDTARRDKMRQWWANTESHSQALAWLKARRKAKLDVNRLEVTFTRQHDIGPRAARSTFEIDSARLDPAALRILSDVAEETGSDLSGAIVEMLNRAGRARRKATLDWFATNGGRPGSAGVELLRDERDAR